MRNQSEKVNLCMEKRKESPTPVMDMAIGVVDITTEIRTRNWEGVSVYLS